MTDLRKAANMALNALEFNLPVIEDFGSKEQLTDCHRAIMALYKTLAQPEQEPKLSDAGVDTNIPLWGLEPKGSGMVVLHQREWVGLTDDEIKKIMQRWRGEFDIRDIERLLKDKNT